MGSGEKRYFRVASASKRQIRNHFILLHSPKHGLSNAVKIIKIGFLHRKNGLKQEKAVFQHAS
jgi:hypothetical protein